MKTSLKGIALIEVTEGFSPRLFDDVGHPCIGYGCDLSDEEAKQYEGRVIEKTEAEALLRSRLPPIEDTINNLVHQDLTQNQFDALVDFCYNEGINAFRKSTLLKCLNAGDLDAAADEFLRWDIVAGKHSKGLLARREKERSIFISADEPIGSTI